MVYIDSTAFPFRIRQGKAIASQELKSIPVRLLSDAIFNRRVINSGFCARPYGIFRQFCRCSVTFCPWLALMNTTKPGSRVVLGRGRYGGWRRGSEYGRGRMAAHSVLNRVGGEAASAAGQDVESWKAMSVHCREDKRQPARGGCLMPDEPREVFFALPLGR